MKAANFYLNFKNLQYVEGDQMHLVDGLHPAVINFAFSVLPTVIFFSALMAVLYHIGLMQSNQIGFSSYAKNNENKWSRNNKYFSKYICWTN